MITKVTKDNKGLYRALFDKATIALYGEDYTEEQIISSLDDYFCVFTDLTGLPDGKGDIYAILPLDEPYFEIDADTRVIKVPSEFRANGISVKGDQIAEIVFFTIDRYYDTTDLYDEDIDIFIQWEAPNGDKGLYPAIFRDITILKEQGKMIFGWTIDNKITKNSGTMKFSVRFIRTMANSQTGQQEIVFSMSTLTANAIVNPGLDFEFDGDTSAVEIIDNEALVRNRFKDSAYIDDDNAYHANAPIFLINIPASHFDEITEDGNTFLLVDLVNGQYDFVAQATSDDGGIITYDWRRANEDAGVTGDTVSGREVYIPTTDTVWSGDYPYYTKNNGTVESYSPHTGYTVGEEIPHEDGDPTYYIKVSSITVTQVGNYWVFAKNRNGKASSTLQSNLVRIPGPAPLSVAVAGQLEEDANENLQVILDENGAFSISVAGSTERFGHDDGVGDKISYTWSEEDQTNNPIITTPIEEETANGIASVFAQNVSAEARGLYDHIITLEVAASRNGATTPQADIDANAKKFRITDAAHTPEVDLAVVSPIRVSVNETAHLEVDASIEGIVSDNLTYQWFKYTSDENDEDILISGATSNELDITVENRDDGGSFYCVVTNHVNGTEAVYVPSSDNFIDVIVS